MTLLQFLSLWNDESPFIQVKTSGSTGAPKIMFVEKKRMWESACATCDFLGLKEGDMALLCMSLDYIAGKMMVVRVLQRRLQFIEVPVSGHPMGDNALEGRTIDFAAMVPLQVYNSIQEPVQLKRLKQIRHLLIGGGALDADLEQKLSEFPHAVWCSYGMTETLSHIALRRVNGPTASQWYTPMPGVKVTVDDEHCLVIDAPLVCPKTLKTNDIGEMAPDGRRFRILGRKDNVICSGGLKIQAEEVERLLRPHLSFPFFITKMKDEKYGEIVVLVAETKDNKKLDDIFRDVLPPYWIPRKVLYVDSLPLTETGKPKRQIDRR
jgi:O-succinylbenzoic acid--CoA ligase